MRKVYEDQNMSMVGYYRSLLEEEGIETSVRNEFAHLAAGEIPFTQVYPELWVVSESDYDKAISLIKAMRDATGDGEGATVEYRRPLMMRVAMKVCWCVVVGLFLIAPLCYLISIIWMLF